MEDIVDEIVSKIVANPKTSITIVISTIGLFFGIRKYFISKKKLNMDITEFEDRNKGFSLYLLNFYRIVYTDAKYLIFQIKITNHSNSKNSYGATLNINYYDKHRNVNEVTLKHQPELFKEVKQEISELDSFIRLEERSIKQGCLIFKLPEHLNYSRVKKYSVFISDTANNKLYIETYISKDILYED